MADKLSIFSTPVLLGCFGLLTLLLAGAAVGRILGLRPGEAFYLTVLLIAGTGWAACRCGRRCLPSSVAVTVTVEE